MFQIKRFSFESEMLKRFSFESQMFSDSHSTQHYNCDTSMTLRLFLLKVIYCPLISQDELAKVLPVSRSYRIQMLQTFPQDRTEYNDTFLTQIMTDLQKYYMMQSAYKPEKLMIQFYISFVLGNYNCVGLSVHSTFC